MKSQKINDNVDKFHSFLISRLVSEFIRACFEPQAVNKSAKVTVSLVKKLRKNGNVKK